MGQEFKQAQRGSSQIHVVSPGVAGFEMAFSLPGLVPQQEKLEAGFNWPLSLSPCGLRGPPHGFSGRVDKALTWCLASPRVFQKTAQNGPISISAIFYGSKQLWGPPRFKRRGHGP